MNVQVDKSHYNFESYVDPLHWNSYYYQITEAMSCQGKDVLIIGIGDGIVGDLISKLGKEVTTLDFDASLSPNIVGSVTGIDKLINRKYDVVICCQVLEHQPFEMFEQTLEKLSGCVREKLILSLPCRSIMINVRFAMFRKLFVFRRFWRTTWDFNTDGNKEHYWEIDATKQYKRSAVTRIIHKHFKIDRSFVPQNYTYHMFYICSALA